MTKQSHAKKLSADAKILIALRKKQPQTKDELYKSSGISRSTLYRVAPLLVEKKIIKKTKKGFAFSDYMGLEEIFEKLQGKYEKLSINDLANMVGKPPEKIEENVYRLAKKYGFEITQKKTVRARRRLEEVFG